MTGVMRHKEVQQHKEVLRHKEAPQQQSWLRPGFLRAHRTIPGRKRQDYNSYEE